MFAPVAVAIDEDDDMGGLDHETGALVEDELDELAKLEFDDAGGGSSGRPPFRSEKIRSRESWPAVQSVRVSKSVSGFRDSESVAALSRSVGRDPRGCTTRSLTYRDPLIPPHVHPQIGRKRVDVSVHADDRYRSQTRHRRMDAPGSLTLVDRSLALLIVPPAREGFPRSRCSW